MKPTHLSPAQY